MPLPPLIEPLESRIAPASLSIADVSMAEGNAGDKIFTFTVTLSQADPAGVTVHYKTSDGMTNPATAGIDYDAAEGDLTFGATDTSQPINVTVHGDTTPEQFEQFFVDLSNASAGTTISKSHAVGTIQNDDADISIADASTVEGNTGTHNLGFTVTLSAALNQDFKVDYQTADDVAVQPSDYTNTHGTLTIAAGATTGTINIPIVGDTVKEPNETFFLNLSNPTIGNLVDAQAVGTITNDDSSGLAISGKTATYTDENGDLVKVTTSKGSFVASDFFFDPTGKQLQTLDLSANSSVAGANITFTAVKQGAQGDGKVNVGYINATGMDLGTVKLPGDLGKIEVGDNVASLGIKSLQVDSLGKNGTSTGAPDLQSHIHGGAGSINVLGDVDQASIFLSDAGGKIGSGGIASLKIGGALKGGAANNSGEIFFTGNLGNATVGSISGGDGNVSGALLGDYGTLSKISHLTIGDLTGGSSAESGEIAASQISSLTINGSVTGKSGTGSGLIQSPALNRVTIHGSLMGGSGMNSGEIFGDMLGAIRVDGDVHGGSALHAGNIEGGQLRSLSIGGSLIGGDFVDASHTGSQTGSVAITGDINSLFVGLDVKGGTGDSSGNIFAQGVLRHAVIGSDFIGHASGATALLTNSGYIQAQRILSLTIGGNFEAGADGGGGIDTSGAIRAEQDIGAISIKGNVVGTATNPAIISAVGQLALSANAKTDLAIKSITVGGDVTRADFLAGYSTDTSGGNSLGTPVNADASIGTVRLAKAVSATNIVAGVIAGADNFFGDATDALISGAGVIDRFDLLSRISSVIIGGHVTAGGGGNFGVVAQQVVAVKANGAAIPLTAGASNDLAPGKAIDGSADFHVVEVV